MELKTLPLSELNRLSEKKAFGLNALELSEPSKGLLWAPQELPPLVHLAEYSLMRPDEQLRYNQLYALGLLEQFIWLESKILCRVIERVLKGPTLPADLRTGLLYFYDEEIKHTEMFWRLLQKAEPNLYAKREYVFFNSGSLGIKAVESLIEAPKLFVVWVWMTIFFEERTLDFSRRYIAFDRFGSAKLDSNFLRVHRLHMQDELRHFMMDVHLLNRYYETSGLLKRQLAARMFKMVLQRLSQPRMMTLSYLEHLDLEFPGFHGRAGRFLQSARTNLSDNIEFKKVSISATSTPRTYALLHRYSETKNLQSLFVQA
jgi:hypothetical protein